MKTCTRCKLDKPLDAFQRRALSPDGLQYWCRDCRNTYMPRYNGTPRRVATAAAYARRNRDVIKAQSAAKYAIRRGQLTRPTLCEWCGCACKPQFHHTHGYAAEHTFTGAFLCRSCHELAHHPLPDARAALSA